MTDFSQDPKTHGGGYDTQFGTTAPGTLASFARIGLAASRSRTDSSSATSTGMVGV